MAHRVNILLDDVIWQILQEAPKGERSRIVNSALTQWFEKRRRMDAVLKMDMLRRQLPVVSSEQLAAWIRADRDRDSERDGDRSS